MESASDRSPDPNRTNRDARHPLPTRMRVQDVDPAAGQIIRNSWAARMSDPLGWNAALRSVRDMLTGTAVFRSYVDPDTQ